MHVAVYTDAAGVGGAEISLAHLIANLPPTVELSVLAWSPEVLARLMLARPDAEFVRLPPLPSPGHPRGVRHAGALLRCRPDILHLNLSVPWAGWWASLAGVVSPGTAVTVVEQLPIRTHSRSQRLLKRLLVRRVDAYLGVGEASAREVEELVGLRRGSVGWIHNGVPDGGPPPDRPLARDSVELVSAGRHDPQKGLDVLLRALALLPPVVRLTLVGDGSQHGELRRLAVELGVANRVRFPGWAHQVHRYLAEADIFVLPSRSEGFPLAILEAMLARLPVVATPVGSVPEAVIPAETGLLAPKDDPEALAHSLRILARDPALRRRLGERGRAHARQFSAEAMARRYLELWEDLVRARRQGVPPRARPGWVVPPPAGEGARAG